MIVGGEQERFSSFHSRVDRFEVEICQVHVPQRQDVYGEDVFPFVEMNFEKLRSQIPVVPLAPRQRVRGIVCGGDLQRPRCVLSIHVH